MNRISAKQFYDEIRGSWSLSYELSELNFAGQHIDLNDPFDEELKIFDIFDFREIYTENLKTKMLDWSEMRNLNENIDVFIKLLRKLKSLQYLIIDHTNLTSNNLWKILKVWNSLNNLSYISAIMEDYEPNHIQFVDLKFYSDMICRILKK